MPESRYTEGREKTRGRPSPTNETGMVYDTSRGVVVRERGGTPFRQYFGAGTALRQISLATGGTLTPNRFVLVRLTLDQFIFWPKLPPNAGFGIKNLQKNFRPPPAPTPSTATRRERGCKLPRCWDLGLGNRSPKSKFTTTPLDTRCYFNVRCMSLSAVCQCIGHACDPFKND